jgi:hypothetical protein
VEGEVADFSILHFSVKNRSNGKMQDRKKMPKTFGYEVLSALLTNLFDLFILRFEPAEQATA